MIDNEKWARVGKHHRNGSVVPVAYLRDNSSLGIGDFENLSTYVRRVSASGDEIVQLLPIFDSGPQNLWPYALISGFAINPVYLSISWVAEKFSLDFPLETDQRWRALKDLEKLDLVAYPDVRRLKIQILNHIFHHHYDNIREALRQFSEQNPWVVDYVRFCLLGETFGLDWQKWPDGYKFRDSSQLMAWDQDHKIDHDFLIFLQWIAEDQMARVRADARDCGILLKGDIPLFVDRLSADCWSHPDYFLMAYSAGAPPDMFTSGGQEWGFPPLNFYNPAALRYFVSRFTHMDLYWDAVRIDHILGVFRVMIWKPEDGNIANVGFFYPQRVDDCAMIWTRSDCSRVGIDPDRMVYQEGIVTDNADVDGLVDLLVTAGLAKRIRNREQIAWIGDHRLESVAEIEWRDVDRYDHNLDRSENEIRVVLSDLDMNSMDIDRVLVARRRLQPMLTHYLGKKDGFVFTFYGKQTWQYHNLDSIQREFIDRTLAEKQARLFEMWRENGKQILKTLDDATTMVLCGEDLGLVDPYVADVLQDVGILGLNVLRWEPTFNPKHVREPAVLVPSTHDTETIPQWWGTCDAETKAQFMRDTLGIRVVGDPPMTQALYRDILASHCETTARWTIIPFWERLAATYGQPDNRINVPGTISPFNWSRRMRLLLSDL